MNNNIPKVTTLWIYAQILINSNCQHILFQFKIEFRKEGQHINKKKKGHEGNEDPTQTESSLNTAIISHNTIKRQN